MAYQFPFLAVVLFAATGLAVVSGVTAWRHREVPGSLQFVVLMALVAYWSLTYGVQLLFVRLDAQLFWSNAQYPAGLFAPVVFLVFILSYTGRERLVTPARLAAASAVPVVTSVVVWVPQVEPLVRTQTALIEINSFTVASISYGPLFLFAVGYSYLFILAGIGLLVLRAFKTSAFYRYRALLLTLGALVPVAGSVVSYVFELTYVDLTPVGLSVFGLTVVVALTRFRLLEVSPVARDRVMREVNDGILVTDARGRIVDVNPAARRILDVDADIGTKLSAAAPDYAAPLVELTAGTSTELVVPGETDRYYQCRETTVDEPSQSGPVRVYILHEVTERRVREEWFRSLTEYSSDVICVLDAELCFTYVSPSVERVLGYAPDAVEGEQFLDYVHDEDAADVRAALTGAGGDPARATYRARTADGEWRTLQSRSKDRRSDAVVEGIILNVRDITETQARKRELQRTNERLDTFASVVSHDLRNPLTVASGRAALLEDALADDPAAAEHLTALSQALDRMERIVDDTLRLARQGESGLEPESIDLGTWLETPWQMVETAEATLELVDRPVVYGDPDQLSQLFENLFRNAVEHGGESVTVRVGRTADGIYLEDDGPGIDPADREGLFETDGSGTEGALSFGLPIVGRIADAHGWETTITDAESGGARFEFSGVDGLAAAEPDAADRD